MEYVVKNIQLYIMDICTFNIKVQYNSDRKTLTEKEWQVTIFTLNIRTPKICTILIRV